MSVTPVAPAEGTPAIETTPSTPAVAPQRPPRASDLLKAAGEGGEPTGTSGEPAKAEIAPPPAEVEVEVEVEVASRLARLAKEQKRLDEAKRKFAEEQKSTGEAAASWKKLQEAKTTKGRMAALDMLFAADEIAGDLYQELTDRIYSSGGPEEPLSRDDVDSLVAKKLDDVKKAETEAATKKAQEKTTAFEAYKEQVQLNTVKHVVAAFESNRANYPALEELPATGQEILNFYDAQYKKTNDLPTTDEVLSHFEQKARQKLLAAAAKLNPHEERRVPRMPTSRWSADATPAPQEQRFTDPKKQIKADLEAAKKALGVI